MPITKTLALKRKMMRLEKLCCENTCIYFPPLLTSMPEKAREKVTKKSSSSNLVLFARGAASSPSLRAVVNYGMQRNLGFAL